MVETIEGHDEFTSIRTSSASPENREIIYFIVQILALIQIFVMAKFWRYHHNSKNWILNQTNIALVNKDRKLSSLVPELDEATQSNKFWNLSWNRRDTSNGTKWRRETRSNEGPNVCAAQVKLMWCLWQTSHLQNVVTNRSISPHSFPQMSSPTEAYIHISFHFTN